MDETHAIIGICISLGLSLFMLYSRKSSWFPDKLKYVFVLSLLTVGLLGLISAKTNNYRIIFYSMIVVVIYFITDKFFKFLCIKIHGRDFYLYLRGSNEILETFKPLKVNKHIKATDIAFSIVLLFEIIGLSALGAVLFGHDNLWNKL